MALANPTTTAIKKVLHNKRLFYVCRDVERAEAGLYLGLKNYKIITNSSPWSKELAAKFPDQIYEIKKGHILDTVELLKLPEVKNIIKSSDFVMVFKPTVRVEAICNQMNWSLINPPAKLTNQIEEKMSQIEWLDDLVKLLPETKIKLVKNIFYSGKKFIIQFNHAHTGSGTFLINSRKALNELKDKFPHREARVVKFIDGPIFTINSAVIGNIIILGNISYQITGLTPFTDMPFATIGNDWSLPRKILSDKKQAAIKLLATQIGKKLAKSGWRGLFGIDVVIDKKTGRAYLIEINARQPASSSFESYLQLKSNQKGATIFASHLIGLLGLKKFDNNIAIKNGAQIVQRVTGKILSVPEPLTLEAMPWRHIRYSNNKLGSDLIRLQTDRGIMANHNELNEHGNELAIFISMAISRKYFGLPRAGMIIVRGNKILLIKRQRNNYTYFTMPGGTIETGEDEVTTAKREILEETGLICEPKTNVKPIKFKEIKKEAYFFAEVCKGKLKLGGPEKERNSKLNKYQLKWVLIKDLKHINLLPPKLKQNLTERLEK